MVLSGNIQTEQCYFELRGSLDGKVFLHCFFSYYNIKMLVGNIVGMSVPVAARSKA